MSGSQWLGALVLGAFALAAVALFWRSARVKPSDARHDGEGMSDQ